MSGQWKNDYSVWLVAMENFGFSIHETEQSARNWASDFRDEPIIREMRVHHETDTNWEPLEPRSAHVIEIAGQAWDAGWSDGYDSGSTYGAEGNSINPFSGKDHLGRTKPQEEEK